jgi:hypothetical protein
MSGPCLLHFRKNAPDYLTSRKEGAPNNKSSVCIGRYSIFTSATAAEKPAPSGNRNNTNLFVRNGMASWYVYSSCRSHPDLAVNLGQI